MKAYFIPGLGADERVFRHIVLPSGYEPVYISWISTQKDESMAAYACRLSAAINEAEDFVLIGLSLGGMLATEISKIKRPHKLILLSSIPVSAGLPFYFRWGGRLQIHKWFPLGAFKSAAIAKRFFTAESSEDKTILKQMIRDCDPNFLRWALAAILTWQNQETPVDFIHIHGSSDRLLPARFTKPTHLINGAGHVLVMENAAEVNKIVQEYLEK